MPWDGNPSLQDPITDLGYGDLEETSISKGSSENTLNFGNDYGSWMTISTHDLEVHVDSVDAVSSGDGDKPERQKP